jgi:predicted nucleotidyltransferase
LACFRVAARPFIGDPPPPLGIAVDRFPEQSAATIIDVMSLETLRRFRREILALASQHGARNVRVFGSFARGDNGADSVIALEQDLKQLLGQRVDVLTDGGLSPYLQRQILAEAAAL